MKRQQEDYWLIKEWAQEFRNGLEYVRNDRLYGSLRMFANFPDECCGYTSDLLAQYLLEKGICRGVVQMEKPEIIELIMKKVTVKYIQRDCKKLLKHFSKKSSKDIGVVAELATLLYAFGLYEEALKVCDMIEDMVFTGNYTIWTKVVNARLVAVRIHREVGNPEKSNELLRAISSTFDPSLYINQKECLDLYDDNIRFAKERNDKANANSWLLLKYEFMIRFYETPDFPIDKNNLSEEIEKTTQEIRKLLS